MAPWLQMVGDDSVSEQYPTMRVDHQSGWLKGVQADGLMYSALFARRAIPPKAECTSGKNAIESCNFISEGQHPGKAFFRKA